jgi:hypothetical protein
MLSDNTLTAAESNFEVTHRKTNRPERFSLWPRRTGEIIGTIDSSASLSSKMAAEYARKRRFGGNETAAGTRKAFFSIPFVGSEIIASHDSETDRDVAVSYQFFYWLRNSRQIGSDLWQGGARLRLNQRNVRAVDRAVDGNVFAEVARSHWLA